MGSQLGNFRDVGGMPTIDGGALAKGVLYRSDAPHAGDGPPFDATHWPPAVVVDLRSPGEDHDAFDWPASTAVHYVPLLAELAPALQDGQKLDVLYMQMLEQSAVDIARLIQLVAHAPGPTLLHCAMGKDRTGVAIAVLLLTAHVTPAAIVSDYAITEGNVERVLNRLRALGFLVRPTSEIPAHLLAISVDAIQNVIDTVTSSQGGVDGWLTKHGASRSDIAELRRKLLN
jgi:hypothetical protein